MFEFKEKDVSLDNLTTRTESHGKEKVPAASLKCSVEMSNKVLDEFAPGLMEALYKPEEESEQADIGVTPDFFPDQKFAKLKPISIDLEIENFRLLVVNEMDRKCNDHIIPECTLKNFRFELMNGGTVKVHFTVNCRPQPEAIAFFYKQQNHNCLFTLEAPEELKLIETEEALEDAAA